MKSRDRIETTENPHFSDDQHEPIGQLVLRLRQAANRRINYISNRAGMTAIRLRVIESLYDEPKESEILGIARAFDLPVGTFFGEHPELIEERVTKSRIMDESERSSQAAARFVAGAMLPVFRRYSEHPFLGPIVNKVLSDTLERGGVRVEGDEFVIPDLDTDRVDRIKIQ